jgi:hypothetical protein
MKRHFTTFATACLLVLALPAFELLSAQVQAAGIGFRNELNSPVVVQGGYIVNGQVRWGKPLVIPCGKEAWDVNLMVGVRRIVVFDANNLKVPLFGGDLRFLGKDLFFAVTPVKTPPNLPPKAQLNPATPNGN